MIHYGVFVVLVMTTPTVIAKDRCENLLSLHHDKGKVWCNNSNKLDSVCIFMCGPYHTLVGEKIIQCIKKGNDTRWSKEIPSCKADRCEPGIKPLRNGVVNCTKEDKVTSVCHYKCTFPDTSMYHNMKNITTCLPSKIWTSEAPCCQISCPSTSKLDVVILMDTSRSVSERDWIVLYEFTKNFISEFTVSENFTQFAIATFTTSVHENRTIYLGDYPNSKGELFYQLSKIKGPEKIGTMVGRALKYVKEVILSSSANRPDVRDLVIVITDGRSSDYVVGPSNDLRSMGAKILGIAVGRRISLDTMLEMSGDESNVFIAEKYDTLIRDKELLDNVIRRICTGCLAI